MGRERSLSLVLNVDMFDHAEESLNAPVVGDVVPLVVVPAKRGPSPRRDVAGVRWV